MVPACGTHTMEQLCVQHWEGKGGVKEGNHLEDGGVRIILKFILKKYNTSM
jgi:hypothetical protein